MAAKIVYQGVQAGSGGGGDLFKNIKFFFTQRVPLRVEYEQMVKANGGEIARLDKLADLVIADHVRKGNPVGSISYRFVEQSVKNGVLEDLEDHLCNGPLQRAAGVGSSSKNRPQRPQVAKSTRTPFTHEDDSELMQWCVRKMRQGAPMKGNAIFEAFEAINPRHPAQSWRDRWLNKLSLQVLPEVDDETEEDEAEVAKEVKPSLRRAAIKSEIASASRSKPRSMVTFSAAKTATFTASNLRAKQQQQQQSIPRRRQSSEHEDVQQTSPRKNQGSTVFSQNDIDLLLDEYDAIMNLDENQAIDAWLCWENEYPNHTAQQWRNYFNEKVRGTVLKSNTENKSPSPAPDVSTPQPGPRRSSRLSTPPDSPSAQLLMSVRAAKLQEDLAQSSTIAKAAVPEIKDSQGSSNRTISSSRPDLNTQTSPDEDNFNSNLVIFAAYFFPDYTVDLTPTICGVQIKLYDLWVVVASEDFTDASTLDAADRWHEVAASLGFEDELCKEAGVELQGCYYEILHQMADWVESNEEPSTSQADELAAAQLMEENKPTFEDDFVDQISGEESGEVALDDNLGATQHSRSSSTSRKRLHTEDAISSRTKRPRVDHGSGSFSGVVEIPSTPEDETKSFRTVRSIRTSPLRKLPFQVEDQSADEAEVRAEEELWNHATTTPTRARQTVRRNVDVGIQPSIPSSITGATTKVSPPRLQQMRMPAEKKPQRRESNGGSKSSSRRNSGLQPVNSRSKSPNQAIDQAAIMEEFMTSRAGLGYSNEIINEALYATSLTIGGTATRVMESLLKGQGIPDDMPGVWTKKDDKLLEKWRLSINSGNKVVGKAIYDKLLLRHGREEVKARKIFLKSMRG